MRFMATHKESGAEYVATLWRFHIHEGSERTAEQQEADKRSFLEAARELLAINSAMSGSLQFYEKENGDVIFRAHEDGKWEEGTLSPGWALFMPTVRALAKGRPMEHVLCSPGGAWTEDYDARLRDWSFEMGKLTLKDFYTEGDLK